MLVEQLQNRFRGSIFGAGDHGYDTARRVYNAMIDKRPRVIAVPMSRTSSPP